MAGYGDYFNKKNKKLSKDEMAKKAAKSSGAYTPPQPEVIPRGKKEK